MRTRYALANEIRRDQARAAILSARKGLQLAGEVNGVFVDLTSPLALSLIHAATIAQPGISRKRVRRELGRVLVHAQAGGRDWAGFHAEGSQVLATFAPIEGLEPFCALTIPRLRAILAEVAR